jgi:hypothetical protein
MTHPAHRHPAPDMRPNQCPQCSRVLWTRADVAWCRTGHRAVEMDVIHAGGAPPTSPDIDTY